MWKRKYRKIPFNSEIKIGIYYRISDKDCSFVLLIKFNKIRKEMLLKKYKWKSIGSYGEIDKNPSSKNYKCQKTKYLRSAVSFLDCFDSVDEGPLRRHERHYCFYTNIKIIRFFIECCTSRKRREQLKMRKI